MEIFGLVLIIILVTLGLLFAVIVLTRPSETGVSYVKESIMAANFLNTMLSTSAIGCGSRTVRNVLQDCGSSSTPSICSNGMNTCEFAREVIAQMLSSTLGDWGKDYQFFIEGPAGLKAVSIKTADCTGEIEGASRPEKVTPSIDMAVNLRICR
ncbi:hypothetical protein KY329_05205 [Candidatus Woesearchaeota archaeon]|nr:hypothetical protein [Candidatus Woesearchaeota archaeon]